MENHKHKLLKQVALRWVQQTGCVVFACEVRWRFCGIVDVLGIKASGDVYIVEAKDSQADLMSDYKRGKLWKLEQSAGFDFLYYIVSDCVDAVSLPTWIGIIDENGRIRRKAARRKLSKTHIKKEKNFEKMARCLSWRAYGKVIRHEQEQPEFSLVGQKGA